MQASKCKIVSLGRFVDCNTGEYADSVNPTTWTTFDRYNDFLSLFEAIKDIIKYLLNEGHKIKLFFASVEDREILIKRQARLKFSDINEYRSFEWGAIYEIGK